MKKAMSIKNPTKFHRFFREEELIKPELHFLRLQSLSEQYDFMPHILSFNVGFVQILA
jgi:hypothetical protein